MLDRPTPRPGDGVSLALAGSGGAGVMTAGTMLLEAAARCGLYGLMVRTSGPQIRGGEAAALLRFSGSPVANLDDRFDGLIAIDWMNLQRFADEMPLDARSLIVGEPGDGMPAALAASGAVFHPFAFKARSKAVRGAWANMMALGLAGGLLGLPQSAIAAVIEAALGRRERGAVEASLQAAADARADATAILAAGGPDLRLLHGEAVRDAGAGRWLLSGNEAAGLGAIRGGVRFVAAYPITPATEMLEWMSSALERVGGVLVQAEDELASINMALGAAWSGVPALTATAGPGLSLMTEALGLAVAAEIPVVVVDVMRGGPSTGIPAKSEQSDIGLAVAGLHGDAPRIVIVPNSIADCLTSTHWAVQLAESLQAPVLVLSDQFLGQTRAVIEPPLTPGPNPPRLVPAPDAAGYQRYADTDSGVSPMSIPGMPGLAYTADGLEHNERGIPSSQSHDHLRQLDKRARKLESADYGERWADLEGDGDFVVLTLGSSTGPVREALARARAAGIAARLVSIRLLAPARPVDFTNALAGARRVLVVEQNHGAQFLRYLRSVYDIPGVVRSYRHPGPLAVRPGEILRQILEWSAE